MGEPPALRRLAAIAVPVIFVAMGVAVLTTATDHQRTTRGPDQSTVQSPEH